MKIELDKKGTIEEIEYLARDIKDLITKKEWGYVLDSLNEKATQS